MTVPDDAPAVAQADSATTVPDFADFGDSTDHDDFDGGADGDLDGDSIDALDDLVEGNLDDDSADDDFDDDSIDPALLPPMGDEAEFGEILHEMVAEHAPRRFAVMAVLGERADARITSWGLDFGDHAEVVDVDGGLRRSLASAQRALRGFGAGEGVTLRLVWVDPVRQASQDDQAA